MSFYPSRKFERIAYEVKVSRSDFLREIADPNKREMAMSLSNRFYYVAPKGMIGKDDVPEDCGLITVGYPEDKNYLVAYTLVLAPFRDVPDPPLRFVASLVRRARDKAPH
jgi:hypothetical protein